MNTKNVLLGLLSGLAVGATLGILFSPEKGTNTRNKISKAGDSLLEDFEDKFTDIAKLFMEKFETLSNSSKVKNAKSDYNKILEDASVSLKP